MNRLVVSIMAVAFVVLGIVSMLWSSRTPSYSRETFSEGAPGATDVAAVVTPSTDLSQYKVTDDEVHIYSRTPLESTLKLGVTAYETFLHVLGVHVDKGNRMSVKLLRPYDMLIANSLVADRFQFSLKPQPNAFVEETNDIYVAGPGWKHVQLYRGKTGAVNTWGLKCMAPSSDLLKHDVCKAVTQNTFTTTEIAKFTDVQGCSMAYEANDPSFSISFCLKRHEEAPQFVGLRRVGDDLHVAAYELRSGSRFGAQECLDSGIAKMGKRGTSFTHAKITTDVLLRAAMAGDVNKIRMEVVPGRLRVFCSGPRTAKPYALPMPKMLTNRDSLKTDLSWPPQVAWRASSGTLALYTFPMNDLSNMS